MLVRETSQLEGVSLLENLLDTHSCHVNLGGRHLVKTQNVV